MMAILRKPMERQRSLDGTQPSRRVPSFQLYSTPLRPRSIAQWNGRACFRNHLLSRQREKIHSPIGLYPKFGAALF